VPRRPPTFEPQRRASRRWLVVAFVAGPVLWAGMLIAVAYAVKQQRAVEIALAIVLASALISVTLLLPMRRRRIRDEESA
jgi:prepilin signal peptidase PulO-like enzyme (type II secretory pathway)